jgi:hypothetical protein
MDDTISIDDPPPFDAEDWIGKNKDYSAIPYFDVCFWLVHIYEFKDSICFMSTLLDS